jgi:hypothetical protein
MLTPKVHGLEAGTHWQVIDALIPVFGIASDKADLAELILSLSISGTSVQKLLPLLNENNLKVIPSEAVSSEDYKFLFILTSSWFEKYGKVIIEGIS